MIRYALSCAAGHRFESWFGSSDGFDALASKGLVTCPSCGSSDVGKAIMAPAVARGADRMAAQPAAPAPPAAAPDGPLDDHAEMRARMRALRSRVLAATQDVGGRFPEEVRRMHDGDIPHRDIRGEATLDEARSLLAEGIMVLPVPALPDELN